MNDNGQIASNTSRLVDNSQLMITDTEPQQLGTSSQEVAISVRNLSKKYQLYDNPKHRMMEALHPFRKKYHSDFWALKDVSFDVKKGETVGIIGRNGSGKSTLLQMICGTLTPTSGEVSVNGRIAAILELGSGFHPELTGRENVFMNGVLHGISREEMESRFKVIEAFAGIGDFIDQPVKTYSSGMMIRLAFSLSVNVEPDILVVDEALAVGDAAFQFKCIEKLDKLTKSGTTVLFVSHDIELVKTFCSHAIYLRNGLERAAGSPDSMAELYLLDMRDEQRRSLSTEAGVTLKPSLGGEGGIAFGTEQGRITNAFFIDSGAYQSTYVTGDLIKIRIDAQFMDSVKNPAITMVVLDRKMLILGACSYPIGSINKEITGWNSATIVCSFRAIVGKGQYFITVKLDDRMSEKLFFPVDKQVGLLSFKVMQPKKSNFQGAVDFAMEFTEEIPDTFSAQ